MTDVNQLITEHLDIWTAATENKSTSGRGNGGGVSLHGIKKLRELILELAVRGKLVSQLLEEGNGDSLKDNVLRARAAAIRSKRARKQSLLPEISDDEVAFEVPTSWALIRLGELTNYGVTDKAEARDMDDDVWVLELEDVEKVSSRLVQRVCFADRRFKSSKNRFLAGDVIYGKLRPYLDKVLIADEDGVCTTEMIPIRAFGDISSAFLRLYLKSPEFIRYADDSTHGMNLPRLGTEKARMAVVPLPPLAEQHRIVAKVDELMRLCDALERHTENSLEAHQALVETCVATLTNSQSAEELIQNWTRIEAHFDTLFTTEESVDQLLEAVVSLAVQGRLSEQSSADVPFGSYWNEIRSSKNSLASKLGARKKKPIPEIDLNLAPFSIPEAWEWVRLDDVVDISGGITKGRKLAGRKTFQFPYLRVANVQRGYLDLEEIKEIALPLEEVEKYQLQSGDLLITEGGDWDKVGRTAVWRCELDVMGHQNHVFRARKLISEQIEDWFELYLNSAFARDYFASSSKQTTNLASINMTQLRSCMVPMPPLDEQKRILAQVKSFRSLAVRLKKRISASARVQLRMADIFTSKIH